MALRHCAAALVAALVAAGGSARAQSLTEELSVTAGGTTEDVRAVGTQVRVFGDLGEALADLLHDQASGTVLLVEDEQTVREFVRKVLEREGYLILEASRGDDALAVASRTAGPIDLLLTDVVMPGMGGHVLWKQLSALRPDIKVLFVSGYTDDAVLRHGVRDSGLLYLQKPFTFAELAREIRQILGRERFVAPGAGRT